MAAVKRTQQGLLGRSRRTRRVGEARNRQSELGTAPHLADAFYDPAAPILRWKRTMFAKHRRVNLSYSSG